MAERSSRPRVATLRTLEFGQEQGPPEFDVASDPTTPGFYFTPPEHPWSDIHYAGMGSTKYRAMWDGLFQGPGIHSEASRTRPMTAGSNSCPLEDTFWTDSSFSPIREAFLQKAYEHLAPPESEDSGSGSEGPGVFSSTDHLGGTERAVPWSFNQFTPMTRMFGGGHMACAR